MGVHYWVMALGAYMIVMSIIGYVRTGSPTAIFINGSLAVITVILGYFLGRSTSTALWIVVLIWCALLTMVMAYMTFKRVAAHANVKAGSEFIFGSMFVFALAVTVVLIRNQLA